MRAYFLGFVVLMLCFTQVPSSVDAQGLTTFIPAETTSESTQNIQEIMRQAKESGVGVVVIDSDGTLRSQPVSPVDDVDTSSEPEHSALMKMQDGAVKFRGALIERLLQLPAAFQEVLYILRAASPDGTLWAFGKALINSLLMFAAGVLFERGVFAKRIANRYVVARIRQNPQGYAEKMPFLAYRFVMGIVGILVSMAVAYVVGSAIFGPLQDTAMQFTVTSINVGYFSCRFAAALWRMILSPLLTQYRIPVFTDKDAKRLHRWLCVMATLDICTILFGVWIGELGLNYDVYAFLASVMSAFVVVMNILLVLVNRRAINNALQQGRPLVESSLIIRALCFIWAPAVIAYVIFAWVQLTYDLVLANPSSNPLIAGAYGILISIIVVYGVINYLIERGFSRARTINRLNAMRAEEEAQSAALESASAPDSTLSEDEIDTLAAELEKTHQMAEEEEARATVVMQPTMNSFEALARRIAGILAFVAGVYAFLYIWDKDGVQMSESLADRLLDITVILFIGYVIYHAFRIWIDTKIEEEVGEEIEVELGDEGGGSSATRLATLLPLFRNFTLILVVVSVLLIILMEMGVNVGPLFVGAGIIGIAIGFGSQALVRDVFAGAFFLFDDAFRKGEYLDVGGVKGDGRKDIKPKIAPR